MLAKSLLENPKIINNKYQNKNVLNNLLKLMEDKYLLKNSNMSILLCGKTNSGKTTFLNSLINPKIKIFPTSDRPETS